MTQDQVLKARHGGSVMARATSIYCEQRRPSIKAWYERLARVQSHENPRQNE
jgi:hypothetical protein